MHRSVCVWPPSSASSISRGARDANLLGRSAASSDIAQNVRTPKTRRRFGGLPSPAFGKRVAAHQVSASRFGSALVFRAARRALRVRNGRCYSRALTAEAEGRASSDKRTRPGAEEPQASPAQLPVHTPSAVARHHHYLHHPLPPLTTRTRALHVARRQAPSSLQNFTTARGPARFTTHHPHVVLLHLAPIVADGELLPDGPRGAARVRVLPAGPARCAIHVCRAPAEQCAQRCAGPA